MEPRLRKELLKRLNEIFNILLPVEGSFKARLYIQDMEDLVRDDKPNLDLMEKYWKDKYPND